MTVAVVALVTVIVAQLAIGERQRRDHQSQIDALLERVRSPELVKPEPVVPDDVEDVPAVEFDNDEAFWKAREVTGGRS